MPYTEFLYGTILFAGMASKAYYCGEKRDGYQIFKEKFSPKDDCEMRTFKSSLINTGTRASDYKYPRVEDQHELWEEAIRIGRLMSERLK